MPIHVIAIGKKHEDWVSTGIERYQKRLKMPFMVEWVLLPHSSLDGVAARQEESQRLLSRLNGYDYVVLLDERGTLLDSPGLSQLFSARLNRSEKIAIIIGGAYGVTNELRQQTDMVWSLSPLVLPHQLVRLILVEQLYRSQEIERGSKYHHQ